MAEVLLLLVVLAVPLAIGAATVVLGRPWWWGALVAIVLFWVAAIAPEPEEGESRLVAGDLVFLLVVSLFVAGLTWLGAWGGRRRLTRARV
jgi:hypothetical protein